MKASILSVFLFASLATFAQSESYSLLKARLGDAKDVHSIHVGGFVLQTALWVSGEDLEDDIGEIKSVRLINIPQHELTSRGLKLSGFKKILADDGFEHVASVKEHGEDVSVYVQEGKRDNLYFMLVEESDEVTAIEIRGHIDPNCLAKKCSRDKIQL